jgi:hypothetical protein
MPDEPTQEESIEKAVSSALESEREGLSEEMKAHLSGEQEERFSKWEKSLDEIRSQLTDKGKEDKADPGAEKVQDLEKRLVEFESEHKNLKEKLRLVKAQPTLPAKATQESRMALASDMIMARMLFQQGDENRAKHMRETLIGRAPYLKGPIEELRTLDTGLFPAGALEPETANAFIDFVISQQATLSIINVTRMNSPQGHTDEMRVASRQLRLAVEATATAVADAITFKRRTLTTVEKIWSEDISLTLLEDAIERRGTEGRISRLIATQFGTDCNDLGWNGVAGDSDPFITINNGWLFFLKNSQDSDVNDEDLSVSAPTVPSEAFARMWRKLPTKFLGRTDLRFFVPVQAAQIYADELSARQTQLGDGVMVNGFPAMRYFGMPITAETHIPSSAGRLFLTPAVNLTWGIQRQMTLDTEWIPRKRIIEYTLASRSDYEYTTGEAVVNGKNAPAAVVGS